MNPQESDNAHRKIEAARIKNAQMEQATKEEALGKPAQGGRSRAAMKSRCVSEPSKEIRLATCRHEFFLLHDDGTSSAMRVTCPYRRGLRFLRRH